MSSDNKKEFTLDELAKNKKSNGKIVPRRSREDRKQLSQEKSDEDLVTRLRRLRNNSEKPDSEESEKVDRSDRLDKSEKPIADEKKDEPVHRAASRRRGHRRRDYSDEEEEEEDDYEDRRNSNSNNRNESREERHYGRRHERHNKHHDKRRNEERDESSESEEDRSDRLDRSNKRHYRHDYSDNDRSDNDRSDRSDNDSDNEHNGYNNKRYSREDRSSKKHSSNNRHHDEKFSKKSERNHSPKRTILVNQSALKKLSVVAGAKSIATNCLEIIQDTAENFIDNVIDCAFTEKKLSSLGAKSVLTIVGDKYGDLKDLPTDATSIGGSVFNRYIKGKSAEYGVNIKPDGTAVLHISLEQYLVSILSAAYKAAEHSKRSRITADDLDFVL